MYLSYKVLLTTIIIIIIIIIIIGNHILIEGSLADYTKSEKWTGTKERVRRKVCSLLFCCAFAIYIYVYIYIYIYI